MSLNRWLSVILMLGLILALSPLGAQADPYQPYDHQYYHHPHGNAYGWDPRHRDFDRHREFCVVRANPVPMYSRFTRTTGGLYGARCSHHWVSGLPATPTLLLPARTSRPPWPGQLWLLSEGKSPSSVEFEAGGESIDFRLPLQVFAMVIIIFGPVILPQKKAGPGWNLP